MRVAGPLPGAVADSLGMYPGKFLRITIHQERRVPSGRVVTTGSYTYGHIVLSPCTRCTPAFLTQVYLHELVHAWLHQYRPTLDIRIDSCALAERFANAGFRVLGGRMRRPEQCGSYTLSTMPSAAQLNAFRVLASTLTKVQSGAVKRWRAR
jgi:hypothetical protein